MLITNHHFVINACAKFKIVVMFHKFMILYTHFLWLIRAILSIGWNVGFASVALAWIHASYFFCAYFGRITQTPHDTKHIFSPIEFMASIELAAHFHWNLSCDKNFWWTKNALAGACWCYCCSRLLLTTWGHVVHTHSIIFAVRPAYILIPSSTKNYGAPEHVLKHAFPRDSQLCQAISPVAFTCDSPDPTQ